MSDSLKIAIHRLTSSAAPTGVVSGTVGPYTIHLSADGTNPVVTGIAEQTNIKAGRYNTLLLNETTLASVTDTPPSITMLSRTYAENQIFYLNLVKAVTAADGDPLVLTAASAISGTVTLNAPFPGWITYKSPAYAVATTDAISYTILDEVNYRNGTVSISVEENLTGYTPTPTNFNGPYINVSHGAPISSSNLLADSGSVVYLDFMSRNINSGRDILSVSEDGTVVEFRLRNQGPNNVVITPLDNRSMGNEVFLNVPLQVLVSYEPLGGGLCTKRVALRRDGEADWRVETGYGLVSEPNFRDLALSTAEHLAVGRSFAGENAFSGTVSRISIFNGHLSAHDRATWRLFDTPGGARKAPSVAAANHALTQLVNLSSPSHFNALGPVTNGPFVAA